MSVCLLAYCDSINGQPLFCKNNGYPNAGVLTECGACLCPTGLGGDCSRPIKGSKGMYIVRWLVTVKIFTVLGPDYV